MKKKLMVLTGLSLASLALASCNTKPVAGGKINKDASVALYNYIDAPTAPDKVNVDNKDLDIYINYNGESGITFRGTSWYNTIDGTVYTQGALLPVWKEIASVTGLNVREACGYKASSNDNAYTAVATAGYKSEVDSSQNIDLFYNSIENLKTAGNTGALVDLTDHLKDMPNLSKYLEEHPEIRDQIEINGHIYYAPYVDGSNDVEKAFIMDTKMVKAVLVKDAGDTTKVNGGSTADKNVLQAAKYEGFINPADQTYVEISDNGVKSKKTLVAVSKGIIEQQNELLATGCSGQALANQLIEYINTRYANCGYTSPADLYISESAAYNVDDLIALMRVIKANPKLLTGNEDAEIEVFFPRGGSASAIENVYDLAQLWGVQGTDSTNGNYYFAADGTLNSLETTTASYEALDYISALYDEGLILNDFYVGKAQSTATIYLEKYFKKTIEANSYGFLMYDDIAIASAANDEVGGLGTTKREASYGDYSNKDITAVLPPVTYWSTKGNTAKQSIKDTTNKELTRYYESSRSLQTTSWAVPKSSDAQAAAFAMIDFMYSEYGQLLQNYGPSAYWAENGKVTEDLVAGEKNAILSNETRLELADSTLDFWSFMRGYLGAGHGIGFVRTNGVNKQAVNVYGQTGLTNIQKAIQSGVVEHAKTSDTYNWNVCVPVAFKTSAYDDKNAWDGITGFWNANKVNKNEGWVNVVVSPYTTTHGDEVVIKTAKNGLPIKWDKMMAQQDARDKNCLYTLAKSLGEAAIPDYAAQSK